MIQIPMKTAGALDRQTVLSASRQRVAGPLTFRTVSSLNGGRPKAAASQRQNPTAQASQRQNPTEAASQRQDPRAAAPQRQNPTAAASQRQSMRPDRSKASPVREQSRAAEPQQKHAAQMSVPALLRPMQKGQKIPLESSGRLSKIRACLGWNVLNPLCDVDVSAFLLNGDGKVPGDDWFVFYGQAQSPDGGAVFSESPDQIDSREIISVDFSKLDARVQKIVFVLTIHEALERQLNFSMIKDAFIRLIDPANNRELASFLMDEYYAAVTSMMIGELYRYQGAWKFSAVGNGVGRDLAGLCALYGVTVV